MNLSEAIKSAWHEDRDEEGFQSIKYASSSKMGWLATSTATDRQMDATKIKSYDN
jgi:hypothetical protein